jgi:hypothetical protein
VKGAIAIGVVLAWSGAATGAVAAERAARLAGNASELEPPAWIERPAGVRFRVRFDPGERFVLGAGVGWCAPAPGMPGGAAPAAESSLHLRSEPPAPGRNVYWKRDHEFLQLRLAPARIDGALYRGLFLRHSREGTLTIPLSPPVAVPLPFDVGLRTELATLTGPLRTPRAGERRLQAGLIHGDLLADFWRSPQPGRWLVAGMGARYDVGLARDAAGRLAPDHLVAPMTALVVALHGERSDGLLAGGLRGEGAYRWSSARKWEPSFRAEAEGEAIPLALNDLPLSVYALAVVEAAGGLPQPAARVFVGLRLSEPLR